MTDPVDVLLQRTAVVERIGGAVPGGVAGLTCARDEELLSLVDAAQAVVRSAEGILAAAAGEVARRSQGDADSSLARRLGEKNAVQLIAHRAGLTVGDAAQLVTVGEAVAPHVALSGEDLPAKRPAIAAAVTDGTLSVPLAVVVERTMSAVAALLWADQAAALEAMLVEKATSNEWSVGDFTRGVSDGLCKW